LSNTPKAGIQRRQSQGKGGRDAVIVEKRERERDRDAAYLLLLERWLVFFF